MQRCVRMGVGEGERKGRDGAGEDERDEEGVEGTYGTCSRSYIARDYLYHSLLQPPHRHTLPFPYTSRPDSQRPRTLPLAHSIRHHNVREHTVTHNHQLFVLDRDAQRREIPPYRFDARIRRLGRIVSQHRNGEMMRHRLGLRNPLSIFVSCSLHSPHLDLACIVFRAS